VFHGLVGYGGEGKKRSKVTTQDSPDEAMFPRLRAHHLPLLGGE
jgi:hypothetical protein